MIPYITAMARPVSPETDMDAWIAQMEAHIGQYVENGTCKSIDAPGEMQVAGEDARWYSAPNCNGMYIVWLFTVHDGDGYYFSWHSDVADPDGGFREFEEIFATLDFTD